MGRRCGHVTYFSNFGTTNISETASLKIQTSNFACGSVIRDTKWKNEKLSKRRRGLGDLFFSRDLLFQILRHLISMEQPKIQTSNFACGLMLRDAKSKMKKRRKGAWPRSRDLLFNFGTPVISLELLKIRTSNFAFWWKVRDTKSKVKNWPKDGVAYVTWPTFQILEPLIFLKRLSWKYKPQILHVDWR